MSKKVMPLFPALAVSIVFLGLGTAQVQGGCRFNSGTGCTVCTISSGDICCTSWACADGSGDGSCGACNVVQFNKMHGKEEVILAKLMAKDAAIASAIKSLK